MSMPWRTFQTEFFVNRIIYKTWQPMKGPPLVSFRIPLRHTIYGIQWLGGFLECPIVQKYTKNIPKTYRTHTKNISKYIQMYPRYTKIYKIPSGGGAAPPGPAPTRPGPDRGLRLGAGPGRAAPPPLGILYILVYLGISWIYLNIFGYMFGIFLVYFWTIGHSRKPPR